jgi:hypothetical protein
MFTLFSKQPYTQTSYPFCTSTMDTQNNVQKRKRADTVPDEYGIDLAALDGPTIIVDHLRHGLPSNIEEDSEDSDVDQPEDEPLEKSTLFQSIQLLFGMEKDDKMRMRKPTTVQDHSLRNRPTILRKIFIILLFCNLI